LDWETRWEKHKIHKRLPRCFDRLSNLVTALHHPAQAVGLSYHGSRIIHSRIANADIQVFQIANSEELEYFNP
jgi:hypothetical protein